uniref:Aminotransferase-like plant mobile domain-containing protein n=1 Tax=Ananas comosus var. bracteatus TaxID=296719 RepID=A0A6V7NHK6_ANACO|nr:unnamed protein product [Ananas comosus var. bracteatus]
MALPFRWPIILTAPIPTPVTRKEHIAFILYWLCHNLFCTRLQKINSDFVPIAVGLANDEKLALGVYFLAFVCREIFDSIKLLPSGEGLAIGFGCDIDLAPHFDTFGLVLGCPKPISSSHPYEFGNYFKVFYESRPHRLISWFPFAERVTGPPWLFTRYETIQGELASSRASKYSDVWFSLLAARDLHVGLKTRSKLIPSTEVYSPQYVARQFGFVQAISAPAKFLWPILSLTVLALRAQPKLIGFRQWGIVFDASSN